MNALIGRLLNAARKYGAWDFAFFKLTLLSVGIILGTYFSDFFSDWIAVIWVVFVIGFIWIGYKTFFRYLD